MLIPSVLIGLLVLYLVWTWYVGSGREGMAVTVPTVVFQTDFMPVGDVISGPNSTENVVTSPSFIINVNKMNYFPQLQDVKDGIGKGFQYTMKVNGSPSGKSYEFPLTDIDFGPGSPPADVKFSNPLYSKPLSVFAGDKELLFTITQTPAPATPPPSATPAAPTSPIPINIPITITIPSKSGLPAPLDGLAADSGANHGAASVPDLSTSTQYNWPSSQKAVVNGTIPGPSFSSLTTSSSGADLNDDVPKSSLVPCSCPTNSMSCPIHAGSQPSSTTPGEPGDTISALTKAQSQFDLMRPFNEKSEVTGFLNTFSSFGN